MACGVINPDGSISITHPDINIHEILDVIKEVQKAEGGDINECSAVLLDAFKNDSTKYQSSPAIVEEPTFN